MMPLKVQSSFAYIGLELYQLGVHTRAKNNGTFWGRTSRASWSSLIAGAGEPYGPKCKTKFNKTQNIKWLNSIHFPASFKGIETSGQSYKAHYNRNLWLYSRTDYKFAHTYYDCRVVIYNCKIFIRLATGTDGSLTTIRYVKHGTLIVALLLSLLTCLAVIGRM